MIVALDYDDTFTRDPDVWYLIVNKLRDAGHTVYGVTMRYPHEASGMDTLYDLACNDLFFTGRKAKKNFMEDRGIFVDVWIDDQPGWVLQDAAS